MAEKAKHIDPRNVEVTVILSNVRSVAKARLEGNDFFKAGNFAEACIAYGEGLKYDPSNSVLHCNRAACRSKLGQWEKSIEDCNEALKIQPNYTKALLRRATSYSKVNYLASIVFHSQSTMLMFIALFRVISLNAGWRQYETMKCLGRNYLVTMKWLRRYSMLKSH